MNLPHPLDRPYQLETYQKILNSKKKFIIVQAPTGSGKSAWPAQMACDGWRVLALVRTKSLQRQYANGYGFTELFGKGNYTCLEFGQEQDDLFDNKMEVTADLCTVPISFKDNCSFDCPYPQARAEFVNSIAGTLNYSKFLLDRPVVENFKPQFLFLDEAHELSNLTVDFSGISLNWSNKRLRQYTEPIIIDTPQPLAIQAGREYLLELHNSLENNKPLHPSMGGDVKEYKWHERILEKIDITLACLDIEPSCWYIYSDEKKFIAKPLTSRFHFTNLFDRAEKIVLMSATIGKPHHFTRELGITDYEYIEVPNIWPAPLRQINDLGAPKLGYKSPEEDWQSHSQLIADRINQCPDDWTGIIHSPSKRLTWSLAERLSKLTDRPIYTPSEKDGTEEVSRKWLKIKDNGTIGIFWQLWEGVDSGKDNICIVAKVPFIDFGDPFDKSRFMFDGKSGYQRIANKMVQGLGRTRRGRPEDYGSNNGMVAIADGHWKRLRNYISKDVLDAII